MELLIPFGFIALTGLALTFLSFAIPLPRSNGMPKTDPLYLEALEEIEAWLDCRVITKGTEPVTFTRLAFHEKRLIPNGWRWNELTKCYEKSE